MNKFLIIFCIALVAIVAAQEPGCGNPVADALGAPTVDEPIDFPADTKICSTLKGKKTCCSKDTFDTVEQIFTAYREAVAETLDQLKNLEAPELPDFDDLFAEAPGGKCSDQLLVGTGITCDQLEKFYKSIVSAFNKFYKALADNMGKCLNGILEFFAGVVCFVCDALWGEYITIDNGTGNIQFTLATQVCDDLKDSCNPLYASVQDLYNEIIDVIDDLGPFGQAALGQLGGGISDICDGDCSQFICYTLVAGYSANFVPPISASTGRSEEFNVMDQIVKATLTAYQPARDLIAKHHELTSKATRAIRSAQAGVSVYSEDGYAATEVGRESELDTEVAEEDDDDKDSSASKIIASIFALLALFAMFF